MSHPQQPKTGDMQQEVPKSGEIPQLQEKLGIVVGYEPENKNGLFESEKYRHIKVRPIFDKLKPQQQESWQERFEGEFGKEAQSTSSLDLNDYYQCLHNDIKAFISTERQRVIEEVVGKISEIMSDEQIKSLEDNLDIAFGEKQCRVCGYNPRHQKKYLLQALKEMEDKTL